MRECQEMAADVIEMGEITNEKRAEFLVNQRKSYSPTFFTEIQKVIGHLTKDFQGIYNDDAARVKEQLDEYDAIIDKGGTIFYVVECLRC